MRNRRSLWQRITVSLLVVAGMAASAAAPAIAARAASHPQAKSGKSHANAIPVRCKSRNKSTGTLKYSDWQFPPTLNQYQTTASVATETIVSLEEPLVQFNNKGAGYPDLITAIPTVKNGGVTNGGKTYTVHLKHGLRWSNGAEITAADVKFGWKLGMNKASGPYCAGTCDVISSISTKGKYDVTFHLKQVFAPFVTNVLALAMPVWPVQWSGAWAKGDVNAATQKQWQDTTFNFENTSFPTNGAYQVSTFVKDDRIVLKPMKYYNTMACGPHVQTLIFAFYSSKPTMIAAAASHQTDETTDYTLADLPALHQHADAYTVHSDPGFLIEHLTFNVDKTYNGNPNPLNNEKVRQALALSLDKYGMIESALSMNKSQASGVVAWSPLIITKKLVQSYADKQLIGQWDPVAKKYQVNTGTGQALADAKKLLDQTPYKSGFTLDFFTTSGNPVRAAQASVIQKGFSKIGVNLNLNFIPAGQFFNDWAGGGNLQRGTFQVGMYADVGYPDPYGFFNDFESTYIDREKTVHSTVNANVGGIHDASFDQAFKKSASSVDPKVRQHWFNVWQIGLNQKAYWVPLFYRGAIASADSKIGNYSTNPTNTGDTWNTFNWIARGKT